MTTDIERAWKQHEDSQRAEANKVSESRGRTRNRQRNKRIRQLMAERDALRALVIDAYNEAFTTALTEDRPNHHRSWLRSDARAALDTLMKEDT